MNIRFSAIGAIILIAGVLVSLPAQATCTGCHSEKLYDTNSQYLGCFTNVDGAQSFSPDLTESDCTQYCGQNTISCTGDCEVDDFFASDPTNRPDPAGLITGKITGITSSFSQYEGNVDVSGKAPANTGNPSSPQYCVYVQVLATGSKLNSHNSDDEIYGFVEPNPDPQSSHYREFTFNGHLDAYSSYDAKLWITDRYGNVKKKVTQAFLPNVPWSASDE